MLRALLPCLSATVGGAGHPVLRASWRGCIAGESGDVRKGWWLVLAGLLLVFGGAWRAAQVQSTGGITVSDVRFVGDGGVVMRALLYVPRTATATAPAPGILAVHGYINSAETQSGFAIEFARRGYVVLALDQTGHGYSGGAAFSNGFGGPAGLRYLRGLAMVDRANIGLEGHSMGGWTVLAAAASDPQGYRAMVLEGSATGAPFAREGTPAWPRNLALVFSRYDEFANVMWGVERAIDAPGSAKLKTLFGTGDAVVPGRVYGDLAAGTARRLTMPAVTHPGDHISVAAIGDSIDWFAQTLVGGTPLPADDQIWWGKEVATGAALIGFALVLLGVIDVALGLPGLAALRAVPRVAAVAPQRWWRGVASMALVPVVTLFPAYIAVTLWMPANWLLPQVVTTQLLLWSAVNAGLSLALGRFGPPLPVVPAPRLGAALGLAVLVLGVGYGLTVAVNALFLVDFRFWVVALKRLSPAQAVIAAVYLVPITLCFWVMLRGLSGVLAGAGRGAMGQYGAAIMALAGGILLFLVVDYGVLFATGRLPTGFDPLTTVIAIQFVPLLALVAVIATFCWRRLANPLPAALICGGLVTWYAVAGTATQLV